MYPQELTIPMTRDLTDYGFKNLESEVDVINELDSSEGTALLVVNSVCGCAAANARPGAKIALQASENKPDKLLTVFAGVHTDATSKAREYLLPYPPSSPAIALFKEGKLVHMLERHHIEGRSAQVIAQNLVAAFEEYCN